MKIFNMVINDRHCEPEVRSFTNKDKAIEEAKKLAKKRNTHPEDLEEQTIEGWEYCIQYCCEGDAIWVVETELSEGL